jgi:hypothetical protein
MQGFLAALLYIGILVLILGISIYLADRQRPNNPRYGSWSRLLGPRFGNGSLGNGSLLDINEKLNAEIAAHRGSRPRQRHRQ